MALRPARRAMRLLTIPFLLRHQLNSLSSQAFPGCAWLVKGLILVSAADLVPVDRESPRDLIKAELGTYKYGVVLAVGSVSGCPRLRSRSSEIVLAPGPVSLGIRTDQLRVVRTPPSNLSLHLQNFDPHKLGLERVDHPPC